MRGERRAKKQIRQSYAEYQRGEARKATDSLAELKSQCTGRKRERVGNSCVPSFAALSS